MEKPTSFRRKVRTEDEDESSQEKLQAPLGEKPRNSS